MKLKVSLTPSQLVSNWSGSIAQMQCTLSEYDIVRTEGFPTLADVNRVFANETSVAILMNHLVSVVNYTGVAMTDAQRAETAMAMLTNYYYLNVAEWCLFFNELKAGKRGQIVWGKSINNQAIMVALHDFASDRRREIEKLEYEKQRQDSQQGFNRLESAGAAIVKGLEVLKQLRKKAYSDFKAFRALFPSLPCNYTPKVLYDAWRGQKDAIKTIYGDTSLSESEVHEKIDRYLTEFNINQNEKQKAK